jgi:hypothetical protein
MYDPAMGTSETEPEISESEPAAALACSNPT